MKKKLDAFIVLEKSVCFTTFAPQFLTFHSAPACSKTCDTSQSEKKWNKIK